MTRHEKQGTAARCSGPSTGVMNPASCDPCETCVVVVVDISLKNRDSAGEALWDCIQSFITYVEGTRLVMTLDTPIKIPSIATPKPKLSEAIGIFLWVDSPIQPVTAKM